MHPSHESIAVHLHRVINQLIFLEKRTILRHGTLKLYPSEIHLLQALREQPDLNGGQLAQRLGVTNGAVSQTLTRLEKKGVIVKTKDPTLKNEMTVAFTDKGMEALLIFDEERASARQQFSAYLAGLSVDEGEAVGEFLSHLEEFLKQLE